MKTDKYGILGWPVKHSVSPAMQEAAFNALGIHARYVLIPVKPEDLKEKISELREVGYKGLNVTVPHKQAVVPFLNEIETSAQFAGSINTIVNQNGTLKGYSTDGYGLAMAIRESFEIDLEGKSFLFWGTGGAAIACSTYFAQEKAKKIYLINRTRSKAQILEENLKRTVPTVETEVIESRNIDRLKDVFTEVDVIIQSTSVGLRPEDPLPIPIDYLPKSAKIIDMIYRSTMLLKEARKKGIQCIDGRGMLLHQGARSFTLWTGKEAPLEIMRRSLNAALSE